jgi:hypothetical protein
VGGGGWGVEGGGEVTSGQTVTAIVGGDERPFFERVRDEHLAHSYRIDES